MGSHSPLIGTSRNSKQIFCDFILNSCRNMYMASRWVVGACLTVGCALIAARAPYEEHYYNAQDGNYYAIPRQEVSPPFERPTSFLQIVIDGIKRILQIPGRIRRQGFIGGLSGLAPVAIAGVATAGVFRNEIADVVSELVDPTTTTTTAASATVDPCSGVTCATGFTAISHLGICQCLCGTTAATAVGCDSAVANTCVDNTCKCGTATACTSTSTIPSCLSTTGTTPAQGLSTATCQRTGSATSSDTCLRTTGAGYAAAKPLCGTSGTSGAAVGV